MSLRTSVVLTAALAAALPAAAQQPSIAPVVDEYATVEDKLGEAVNLDVTLRDESGQPVVVRELLSGERPVILNLGYFSCPNVCGEVFVNLFDGLENAEIVPGRDVDVLTISIDAREGHELAAAKKQATLELLGVPGAGDHWRFLTGDGEALHELAWSAGFRYRVVEGTNQIDHPPVVTLLSPEGIVTRYIDGQVMTPVTLRRAVVEAGEGKVGSFLERLFVSCMTYDPSSGAYGVAAMTVMRIGGALTAAALGLMIFVLWRRERHRPAVAAT